MVGISAVSILAQAHDNKKKGQLLETWEVL